MAPSPPALPTFPYEFDSARRISARAYERGSRRLGLIGGTAFPFALALLVFLSGASARLADVVRSALPGSPTAGDAVYIVLFCAAFAVATLPVAFYLGHLRERRFEMSHRTAGAFLKEAAKGTAVAVVFALVLLLPFFWVVRRFDDWWMVAAALYGGYLVLSAAVVPHVLVRLFYKVEPLADGPLRNAVLEATGRAGLPEVQNVVVIRESAKSPRANAFVHGLGPSRRVVLYDTLVQAFHPREVAFTVAHEVGHLAHRDVPKSLALSLAAVFPEVFLLSLALDALGPLGGAAGAADVAAVPLILAFIVSFGFLTRPGPAWLHRRSERRADMFALEATGDGMAAASMFRRVCDLNMLDDAPPALVERFLYSHPAPHRRIRMALEFSKTRPGVVAPASPG